ncbi:MAG: ribonuclease E inhibitor RraB [Clostridiaceae bacterium]
MLYKENLSSKKEFPNDADGDALRRLFDDGIDFSKPHNVDFFVVVPDLENGEKIKQLIEQDGFDCSLEVNEEMEEWTCYCSKKMKLDYEKLILTQEFLNKVSKPYNGFSDGWGILSEDYVKD